MDLFEYANQQNDGLKPLAERMRPQTLNEFIGQEHIVGEGSLLRRAIAADRLGSCIFYGPPGTGKTTLANIIAKNTNSHFEILNAVSSGVADAKRVIEEAKNRLMMYGKKTYLLLDECHRWNKAQSDSVLSAIEQGYIVFIGSTTENPYVSMTKAIVSRCRLFEFHSLTDKDVLKALNRAINDKRGLFDMNVVAEESALEHLAWASGGDVRTALNALELAAVTTSASADGAIHITKEIAAQSIQKRVLSISDDNYYDMLSAFCKSLRGSDSNAGLYWAMRLIDAGCDPLLIFRRIIAHSAEDVGKLLSEVARDTLDEKGIYLAVQCCEHLNRAVVVSNECAEKYGLDEVNVVPWLKGGGSFATATYYGMKNAVMVETIKAHAGLDIGGVMIGMRLKEVAVPVRLVNNKIGEAYVSGARVRPKFVGGERARYNDDLK